jgi:hypothetical protein
MAMIMPAPPMIRICPGCRRSPLRPVYGGLGKMGRCARCGYTGPLRIEPEEPPADVSDDDPEAAA